MKYHIVDNAAHILYLRIIYLNGWLLKELEVLRMIDFRKFDRIEIKHAFANKLFFAFPEKGLKPFVDPRISSPYVLVENRHWNGFQQLVQKKLALPQRLLSLGLLNG